MKILIAEDDCTSRIMLQAILSGWGHEVLSAADGEEAWRVLQQPEAPRLTVLDLMMPGMDGITLCRKLREEEQADPAYIIILTSQDSRKDIVQGLEAGADDYVTKPYDNDELRARINVGIRVLELQSAVAERQKLQGVIEMAGAVCHELNQPLQVVSGYAELLMKNLDERAPQAAILRTIKEQIDRIGEITGRMMRMTKYQTKNYMGGKRAIVDIESASAIPGKPKGKN